MRVSARSYCKQGMKLDNTKPHEAARSREVDHGLSMR